MRTENTSAPEGCDVTLHRSPFDVHIVEGLDHVFVSVCCCAVFILDYIWGLAQIPDSVDGELVLHSSSLRLPPQTTFVLIFCTSGSLQHPAFLCNLLAAARLKTR